MRIMIKGGVWKNTEDEILKAAVMKYGKNQWSRISSLLVRKSAKQCKARWYEWLDPSIKKTEWTRDEDEKLLHLAKLMPTQWRTIAPIVGRTPTQCLERYEKLLDAAMARDGDEEKDDPRRLRPGEIDPHPETKPARPDPIDMDEDEKEMLSEARARLANTRGRKAKRKSREKLLEEAKRLASMQKKRELEAAGIDIIRRRKASKGIDYSKEVAFEHKPAPGFYDTTEETNATKGALQPFRPVSIQELEGPRRKDVEDKMQKIDLAKQKIRERKEGPEAMARQAEMNEAASIARRSKLLLPKPQVSDSELEAIARMGNIAGGGAASGGGDGVTGALVGTYASQTPSSTFIGGGGTTSSTPAMRTPSGRGDALMLEAENLAKLRNMDTPLKGGEMPELHPTDFSGATPNFHRAIATPNALAGAAAMTPGGGATPMTGSIRGGVATPASSFGTTPLRDEMNINDTSSSLMDSRSERLRQKEMRATLKRSLKALPAATNEYQIIIPDLPEEEEELGGKKGKAKATEEGEGAFVEDAADVDAARARREEEAEQAALKRRSQPVQRGLPRPRTSRNVAVVAPPGDSSSASLIAEEIRRLIDHDVARYPPGGRAKASGVVGAGIEDEFTLAERENAALLIEAELLEVGAADHDEKTKARMEEAIRVSIETVAYVPAAGDGGGGTWVVNPRGEEAVAAAKAKHAALTHELSKLEKRLGKLSKKVGIVNGGFELRAEVLGENLRKSQQAASVASIELESFKRLREQETRAVPLRLREKEELVSALKERERGLQRRYAALLEKSGGTIPDEF